ncbi:MAG: protein TolR [Magnetospirillum sp. WYHS-4]
MGASIQKSVRSGGRRGKAQPMSEINVTPFVDVMLVLLVIFMVTAPLLTVGVQVDLPKTSATAIPGQDEPLAVSVDATGKVYIMEAETDLEALGARLMAITHANPEARIFVRGDKGVNYGRVMEVMGAINASGFRKVALITASKDNAPPVPKAKAKGGR